MSRRFKSRRPNNAELPTKTASARNLTHTHHVSEPKSPARRSLRPLECGALSPLSPAAEPPSFRLSFLPSSNIAVPRCPIGKNKAPPKGESGSATGESCDKSQHSKSAASPLFKNLTHAHQVWELKSPPNLPMWRFVRYHLPFSQTGEAVT